MLDVARPLFWSTVAGYAALVGWLAVTLPARVAMHVGTHGVDRWAGRSAFIAAMSLSGLALVALFWLLIPLILRSAPAGMVNVPHREYWLRPENRASLTARMTSQLLVVGAATLALVGGSGAWVALDGRDGDVTTWPLSAAVAVYVAGLLAWAIWLRIGPTWRPPPEGS